MKCLSCDRIDADEVNITVNVSRCDPAVEPEYTGDSEYGYFGDHPAIGTLCDTCGFTIEPGVLVTVGNELRRYGWRFE